MPKVTVEKHRNKLRLRWQYQGKRYCFTPVGSDDNPLGRSIVRDVKSRLEFELQAGTFDPLKYRPRVTGKNAVEIKPADLIRKFGQFKLKDCEISPRSFETRYEPLAASLERELDVPCHRLSQSQAKDFARLCDRSLTSGTAKGRLWLLCSAWKWGQTRYDLGKVNPWESLTGLVKSKPQRKHVKPFSVDELRAIKESFSGSKYECLVILLISTAARPGELFGLRWMDVSEDFQTIWIRNAVSRGTETGTTKTGTHRQVPLTSEGSQALRDRHTHQAPESFVFPGVSGQPIKDQSFRSAWRRTLAKSGIEYRCPRNVRPSVISINRLMNPNIDPVRFAELCGHSLKTQDEVYRRAISETCFLEI